MPKRETLSKYAPAVFWAGVIVLLLGLIVIASGATAGSGRGPIPTEYMLIGGLVLMVISAFMNPDAVRGALGLRSVRYGGNALVLTLGFVAILGVLNYLGTWPRFEWRQDFTANQQFTIAPQTAQILQNLKQPVKATALFSPQAAGRQEAEDRLKEYQLRAGDKFTYEFVDPIDHPDIARNLGLTRDGGIVFESGSKKQEAISTSEQDFTTAILKVTSDTQHTVAFITGHKERDLSDTNPTGFSTVRQWLEKDNYATTTLNTLITTTIPASITVVVLASPQVTLTAAETSALSNYLDQGGRLLVMSDPSLPEPLGAVIEKWGVKFDNDEVVDPVQYVQSPLLPAVQQYPFSTITQKMNGLVTVFPLARSLSKTNAQTSTVTVQSIVQTTDQAWGETNLDPKVQPQYDASQDIKGPLDLVISLEGTQPISGTAGTSKTRVVVFGNSEFVSDNIMQATQLQGIANIDLFMNSVNWLAEEDSLISIRATPPDQRTVEMTAAQQSMVFLLSVVVLPALVFIGGFSVWWRRR
jgi:ABC-type uncharacterized transport system involved in gliding motility auxiliary subunit